VWRNVVCTQPRRSGKTVLLGELAAWRASQAVRFGEPQNVVHVANNVALAVTTQEEFHEWSVREGFRKPRLENGRKTLFVDGGDWRIFAQNGASFGSGSTLRLIDESAFMDPVVKESALDPTGVGRVSSQSWLFGMASDLCTPLVPEMRERASDPARNVMLAEWSAASDADVEDWSVWERCLAYESAGAVTDFREAFRDRPRRFRANYLNQWPGVSASAESLGGWGECGRVEGSPLAGGVAAVECARDRSVHVAVVAVPSAGGVGVWCHRARSLAELGPVLDRWRPARVLLGASLVPENAFGWEVEAVGTRQLGWGTPVLVDRIRSGELSHEHSGWVDEQVLGARLSVNDSRTVPSDGKSDGSVEVVRALAWAVWGLSVRGPSEDAAIW
jgi:hypothetical protein